MAWLVALPLGLAIVYLAARYGRFRNWIEPVLSIAVALERYVFKPVHIPPL